MKNLMILAAMLFIISMTSCSNEGNDPITLSEESNISMLTSYGARSLSSNDAYTQKLQLEDLPAISIKEANSILSAIKKHDHSQKEYATQCENSNDNMVKFSIAMNETISNKYTFSIQLNMEKDTESDVTYFKNYTANCSSDTFAWYIKGFSFATDNETGNNKFESPSYLFFKIADNGIYFIQVPVSVKGSYNPDTEAAEFSYKL